MKKITLLFAFYLFSTIANAQIPNGSVAPNFTVTDINGVSHTLSTYLAAGKTVIMDVSTTWCVYCWDYHKTKALEDLYQSYGPGGSNEVIVLFIEADPNTNLADLQGTTAGTKGNWIAGTSYPIIDGSNIKTLYQVSGFPTLFRICPNGLVSEISTSTANSIRGNIITNCAVALTGVQNHVECLDSADSFCSTTGIPNAKIKNLGANTITSATLNLKENGVIVDTKAYTGSILRLTTRTIPFNSRVLNPVANYTVEVANVNNAPIFNSAFATADLDIAVAQEIPETLNAVIKIKTDGYPAEMTWNITNSLNAIVASGGPYVGAGGTNAGGPDANTTKTVNAVLSASECYTVTLNDGFGDGWSVTNGLQIFDANNVLLYNLPAGNFGYQLLKKNAFKTAASLATVSNVLNNISLYPNPSNGIFQLETVNPVQVSVTDILGKTVFVTNQASTSTNINLTSLEKGVYLAKIVGDNINTIEKLILK